MKNILLLVVSLPSLALSFVAIPSSRLAFSTGISKNVQWLLRSKLVNEDEVIDAAEAIFIRIADQIINLEVRTVREVFHEYIIETEIQGQLVELLTPEGLIEGIKNLGITDLSEKEVKYLLRVLTKPELEGAIVLRELL